MGHMAFLCGVVVFLGLPLLLQSLCEDLQGAGMAPRGSLGSSGVVTNEIHTQAWPLQEHGKYGGDPVALCRTSVPQPQDGWLMASLVHTDSLTLALAPGRAG